MRKVDENVSESLSSHTTTIFQASSFGLIGNLYGPEMFEINIQMGYQVLGFEA